MIGPELIHEPKEEVWIIREILKTVQSKKKKESYADVRKMNLQFDVDD